MTQDIRDELPTLGALVLLDLVAAACLGRLFTTPAPLLAILTAVVAGHAIAFGCRHRNLSIAATAAAVAAGAFLLMAWLVVPSETLLGIPTPGTLSAIGRGVGEARRQFGVAVAPTQPSEGFTMACVAAVVVLAALADWGAFRIRATIEATVPAFTVFVFAAVLGTTTSRTSATMAFGAALLVWFVAHNATVVARTRPWFNGTASKGRRAVSRAGVGVSSVALVAAAIGLSLPFTQTPPAVAWRNNNQSQARTTVSPLVDIRTRLVTRDNVVAFTVDSTARAYWRLTSLDSFDGRIWSSHGNYKDVGTSKALKNRSGARASQRFTIADLKSIWLPAAYRPASTPSVDNISYDESADAFITADPTSDGLDYRVSSVIGAPTPEQLRAASPVKIAATQLALPAIDSRVVALARQLTASKTTAYDKALAIQQHFRSGVFKYDLAVPPGHTNDDVARFLFVTKRGYCEQFAGTFAVLARAAGLPTRVAVGFTPGDPTEPNRYVVRELNAHAWPEVFLGSAGWVSFEPTPGRGIPGAESYTGAVESQADSTRPGATSTIVPTTVSNAEGDTPGAGAATSTTEASATNPQKHDNGLPVRALLTAGLVIIALGALLCAVPLIMASRRRRRYSSAADAAQRVLVAWNDTNEALRFAGAPIRAADTPRERVVTATSVLSDSGVATLERLADNVDLAAYAPPRLTDEDAETARTHASEVRRLAFGMRSRWQRLLFAVNPKRLKR
ncbi:MAG: transglutaminase domain-containing protein [Actinobacteria bacterium]|nr:transglutaminase domain-containing protein [Actinomycetota bacterium]